MDNKSYFNLVVDQGKIDTRQYYRKDRRAWTYNIGAAILFAIISPIVYNGMGLIMDDDFWLSVLAGLVSGAIFFCVWYCGTFLYHLWLAPARIFREQENLANKDTWRDVAIEYYPFPKNSLFGSGLRIKSNKNEPYYIQRASATIGFIQSQRYKIEENKWGRNLSWVKDDQKSLYGPEKRLAPGQERILLIANWHFASAFIAFDDNPQNHIPLDDNIPYDVEIELHGEVNGHGMESCVIACELVYEQDKVTLEKRVLITIKEKRLHEEQRSINQQELSNLASS